ncbi:MAG: metallophosphoesterase [Clostridia bacterium]
MEKNRAGRNRRRVIWIDMLALAGILVIAAVIWSGFLEDAAQENLATKTRRQTAEEVPENPLQIILSMGAEPGSLSISWKGDPEGPEALQLDGVTGEKQRFTAVRERILKSDYYRYHVELSGLTQGTEYRYTIGENAFSGSFHVPQESDVTRFLYLGDVQFQESMEEYEEWGQMVRRAYREHPDLDFAVIGGDLVNSPGELSQWEAFLEACDVFAKLPLATVSGNHEGVHSNYTYQKLFALPDDAEEDQSGEEFYSLDFGNVRMLMMDSSFLTEERRQSMGKDAWAKEEQRVEAWIRSRTGSCEKPWLAAVIHHPVYGMHDEDTVSPQIRRLWAPLLETGGVRIVFSGHQHLYQRTRSIHGVVYLMGNSGQRVSRFFHGNNLPEYTQQIYDRGANYQIVEAGARRLKMTSYNKKGLVIDETVLGRGLLFHIFEFFRSGQVIM